MRRMFTLFLLCALLLSCAGCAAAESGAGTRLIALNVGKADCLLLLFEDKAYLIDAGWERTYGALREALNQYGVSRLDGVFLTHCDKDHYGGMMQLAQSDIVVDAWYAAALYYDAPSPHPLEAAAALRGDSVQYLCAGDALSLSDSARLTVLGPLTLNTENENNNSLVFSVETDDGTLLFTGDMKLAEEAELLAAGLIPQAEVLKVPFHGDNSASSESFVAAVQPQAAVICTSSSEEPDTPASSILKRYGRYGAAVFVTQNATRGVEITLKDGLSSARDIVWDLPDYSGSLRAVITQDEDLLTLYNSSSQAISLKGWLVFSTRGEDTVLLPDDAVLPANGVYKIGTRATGQSADLSLDIKRLWHKSKYDQALIYDGSGAVVAVTDNGLPE